MHTTLWRIEVLRARRTHTFTIAAAVCGLIGAGAPFMALYSERLIALMAPGTEVDLPPVTPVSGVGSYVDNVTGPVLLVAALVGAMSLALDGRPARALFYRTRVPDTAALVLPRYTVAVAAVAAGYAVGVGLVWAVTALVLGDLPVGPLLLGAVLFCVYLAFVVGVVALAAGLVRHLVAVLGVVAGVLAVTAALAQVQVLMPWTPMALVSAQVQLVGGASFGDFLPALAVTSALTAGCVAAGIWRSARREV